MLSRTDPKEIVEGATPNGYLGLIFSTSIVLFRWGINRLPFWLAWPGWVDSGWRNGCVQ